MRDPQLEQTPPRALRWPIFIVSLLGAIMVGLLVMVKIAISDPSFALEPNYYQKAIAWDEHAAQVQRSAALGWRLTVGALVAGPQVVSVALTDGGGAPIEGASIALEGFSLARATGIVKATLLPVDGGRYQASVGLSRAGLWELRFIAQARGESFLQTLRVDVGARPRTLAAAAAPSPTP